MELLLVLMALAAVGGAAILSGADTRDGRDWHDRVA